MAGDQAGTHVPSRHDRRDGRGGALRDRGCVPKPVRGTREPREVREAESVELSSRVEQVISGRVGRLGDEIKILVWVTGVPGRERWLTVDRSLQWEETWEGIDALAVAISEAYFSKLEQERGP